MTSDSKKPTDADSTFSFGVRELRDAKTAQGLTFISPKPKQAKDMLGVDPYNTSGSFDRKKNWTRVGKR